MSLPNPGMDFDPFDTLPASDLNDMVENIEALADGTGLDADAIADSKLKFGKVRSRQGGSATDWSSPGTNNYDESANNVIIQTGVVTTSSGGVTNVTFPTPFTQKPVVFLQSLVDTGLGQVSSLSNTTLGIYNRTLGGPPQALATAWIAIGV